MYRSYLIRVAASLALLAATTTLPLAASADEGAAMRHYRVTLQNLTTGQPFSPPVAATHRPRLHMFQVGRLATDQLAAIAQDGNEAPMVALLNGSSDVTQTVDIGRPLTTRGRTIGSFTDTVTFDIMAHAADRFSLATMLICTNDGFLGLDAVQLPPHGMHTFELVGWDAGRENNTEQSEDIVDPCSALGPVPLSGDPNGNRDTEVATVPPEPIHLHPGIAGSGDLSPAMHGWSNPVARVTIERLVD
jgi:Spondin_N